MVGRSQHPGQIMENQTRYDLNAAIENWRQELAAQANLTAEVRRELETHLRDALAGFQQRGLTDEESFWLARRRVGQPELLGKEFVKADPMAVWRERILWMAGAALVISLWNVSVVVINMTALDLLAGLISRWLGYQWAWQMSVLSPVTSISLMLLRILPLFLLVVILLRGRGQVLSRLSFFFQSRARFLITATVWFALNEGWLVSRWLAQMQRAKSFNGPIQSIWTNVIPTSIWPLALVALIAWLIPPQKIKIPKGA